LKEILVALDESSILTVSDMPAFSRRGGMIQFVLEGDKVRFEINLTKAETAKLTLSSELLKVATTVRRNARQGDYRDVRAPEPYDLKETHLDEHAGERHRSPVGVYRIHNIRHSYVSSEHVPESFHAGANHRLEYRICPSVQ